MVFWNARKVKNMAPEFDGPDNSNLEAFIRSFCRDYKKWNDYCVVVSEETECDRRSTISPELSRLYAGFVGKYSIPKVNLQLISYGTDATFDADRLSFGSAESDGDNSKQTFFIKSSHGEYANEYHAHIVRDAFVKFKLQQIYYVDPFPEDSVEGEEAVLPCL